MENSTFLATKCQDKIGLALLCNELEKTVLLKIQHLFNTGQTEKIKDFGSYHDDLLAHKNQKILDEKRFKVLCTKIAGDVVNQSLFLIKMTE
jgi:hypothetical protein